MISFEAVTHRYGERTVLDRVDLRLDQPRVGVIGANGSGKSTLARMINGLVIPSEGTVTVEGLDTRRDAGRIRRRVGFCFADPDAQIVMPTPAEDIAFSLRRSGLSRAEITARVDRQLLAFGLEGRGDQPAALLSGGEKQLLALAAVMITEPAVLVCDEPTTLLDLRHATEIRRRLTGLAQQVIIVSHDLELVAALDRVIVLDRGCVVADDEPGPAIAAYRELMR